MAQIKCMGTSAAPTYMIVFSWSGVCCNTHFILSSTLDHVHPSSLRSKQIPLPFPAASGDPRLKFDFKEENHITKVSIRANCS